MKYDHPNLDVKNDTEDDVKMLFMSAKKRKEEAMKYHLLGELLAGKSINLTKSDQLYEAVNREKMEFEEIMKLHPEEVNNCIEYVKERKQEQGGQYWNSKSDARWGEWGTIPSCVYFARPSSYWKNLTLKKNFFNTFSKFRISEKPL